MATSPYQPAVDQRLDTVESTNTTQTTNISTATSAAAAAQADADSAQAGVFDVSGAATETITAAGAISVSVPRSALALTGAGAVTLAAPAAGVCRLKFVEMTVDNGDVTLAATNIVGGAAATFTFGDVGDRLVLVADNQKWVVLKNVGVGEA